MRKRLLILAGVALAAAVIVLGALELRDHRQKLARSRLIDSDHYDQVTEGMKQDEVEATLGGPPGDFTTESVLYFEPTDSMVVSGERWEYWSGNGGQIAVRFDEQGTVRGRDFRRGWRFPPPSLAERVRAWIRLLRP
jgi:hypothetical protein